MYKHQIIKDNSQLHTYSGIKWMGLRKKGRHPVIYGTVNFWAYVSVLIWTIYELKEIYKSIYNAY